MLIGLFLQVERDKCSFLVEKVLAWVMASEIWTDKMGVGFLVANGNNRIERGCEVPRKWWFITLIIKKDQMKLCTEQRDLVTG